MRAQEIKFDSLRYFDIKTLPIYFWGLLWCIVLAVGWRFEEQSKFNTIIVNIIVFAAASGIIEAGKNLGIVRSRKKWMIAFLLKMTLSFVITSLFWFMPLDRAGILRVPSYVHGIQDSNLYDFYAAFIAQYGFHSNLQFLRFTWLSSGIVTYISAIYALFGINVLYVSMFNTLFSLVTFISITGTLQLIAGDRNEWQWMRYGMFIPLMAYYDATPAKEPVSVCFYYLSLFLFVRLLSSKKRGLTYFAMGIVALAAFRPSLAALFLITNLTLFLRNKGRKGMIIAIVAVTLLVLATSLVGDPRAIFVEGLFNVEQRFDALERDYSTRVIAGDSGLKLAVGEMLLPRNFVDLVLLSPLRSIIWISLPYPLILPSISELVRMPELLFNDPVLYSSITTNMFGKLSAWMVVISSPYLISAFLDRPSQDQIDDLVLLLNLVVPTLLLGNFQFIQGRRYRIFIEPLILAISIWAHIYGRPKKYRYTVYFVLGCGLLLYAVYALF